MRTNTPRELPDELTQLTVPGLLEGFMLRWETLGVEPRRAAIELKTAHVLLETGLKFCHCWNLGNLKWRPGQSWCFFSCGEEIVSDQLSGVVMLGQPKQVEVVRSYKKQGKTWYSLWIRAPHPWTKFAAFDTLADGLEGQLEYLRNPKRAAVLAALQTGDPVAYCQALHRVAYFTADPMWYLYGNPVTKKDGLEGCLLTVLEHSKKFDWGDVL